ncbi:MAG: FecR family protein [Pseudomonadota bacterium]
MRRHLIPIAMAAFLPICAGAAERAGNVIASQQDAYQAQNIMGFKVERGDTIFQQAKVYTKAYGSLQIKLDDGSDLLISPNSEITIDEYVFQGTVGSLSLSLGKGALRMISGRLQKPNYTVNTTIATIGIRGTRFWLDRDTPDLLKIWTDEGTVVARPLQSDREFVFVAPVYAECTITACQITAAPPPPQKFPTDPTGRGTDGADGSDGGNGE